MVIKITDKKYLEDTMKKIVVLIVTLMPAFSVIACGGNSADYLPKPLLLS